jgi:hypothetical protein
VSAVEHLFAKRNKKSPFFHWHAFRKNGRMSKMIHPKNVTLILGVVVAIIILIIVVFLPEFKFGTVSDVRINFEKVITDPEAMIQLFQVIH